MWHKNSEKMTLLGLMDKIFNFELFVVLMTIFYKLDSLFVSFDVIYDIYTQYFFGTKNSQ